MTESVDHCGFENGEAVAVVGFDYPSETPTDEITAAVMEAMNRMAMILLGSRNIKRDLAMFVTATGVNITMADMSDEECLIRRFCEDGTTKQSWQQGVERIRKEYGLRKTRVMRSEDARNTMRRSNYRGFKVPK